MKQVVLTFFLISLTSSLILAQQTPTPTPPAGRTTAPARTLTPAEQRQKEKIEREVQRERQIRAEWLQKQRDYEARQAEKERQRQAKQAGKEQRPRETEQPKVAAPTPAAPPPTVVTPAEPTEPKASRSERRRNRRSEPQPAPPSTPVPDIVTAPAAQPTAPAVAPTPSDAPVSAPALPQRAERVRRERRSKERRIDTVAVVSGDVEMKVRPDMSQPRREFLPKGHLFEPILLDPLEAQTYGSVLPSYHSEGRKYPGTIVPFAFGFAKPFYRRTTEPGRSEEIALDLASFTQFEVYYDDQTDKQRRQIMNTDYKISILYNVRRGLNNYRFRFYHLSSHLGDDYVFRNRITAPTPNPVNYELIDATYSRIVSDWRLYGGLGIGLRKPVERKTFSAQLGTFYKKPSARAARLVGGLDVKFWQQTNFRPGIHGGIGVEVGRTTNNLTFLIEGYSGFRPYGQYEHQQTAWIGAGVYLNPF